MNNHNINLINAWKKMSSSLSFDVESLSNQFKTALSLESKTVSLEDFNAVLSLFSAMDKKEDINDLIENYIDANLGNEEFYTSNIDRSVEWNETLLFKVDILRKLHQKCTRRKINDIVMSLRVSKEDKGYLINATENDWIEYLNYSQGLALKKSIKMINEIDLEGGKKALLVLKSRCNLSKIAIEIMEAA